MPRPLRIDFPNAWHFVLNHARSGREVFREPDDFRLFIDLIIETVEIFDARITAFCLVPTNYLLLLQTPDGTLTRCMRHINGVYTQRYNASHGCEGQLFRGRYKSILIDADNYLIPLVHHIHTYPVRCGQVETLTHYPWSSHKGYLSSATRWNWINKEALFSMLVNRSLPPIRAYKRFMAQTDSSELCQILQRRHLPSMLGNASFINRTKTQFPKRRSLRAILRSRRSAPSRKRIIAQVCQHFGVTDQTVMQVRRGNVNDPRDVAIFLVRTLRAEPFPAIATGFNLKRDSSVGSVIARVKERLNKDRQFKIQVTQIKTDLATCTMERPHRNGP